MSPSLDIMRTLADFAIEDCTVTSWKHAEGYWCCRATFDNHGYQDTVTVNNPSRILAIQGAREVVERIRRHPNAEAFD